MRFENKMENVCPKCGLPKELCVCETISKEAQKIRIYTVQKRFKKVSTIVAGLDEKTISLKDLTKKLKSALACGGTSKNGKIEVQGNHVQKVRELLIKEGFSKESIEY